MMDLRQSETWRRHQLAAVERVQADVARYTRPIMRAVGLAGIAYLAGWGAMFLTWQGSEEHSLLALSTALLATIILLGSPAFALAAGIEWYFRRRLVAK